MFGKKNRGNPLTISYTVENDKIIVRLDGRLDSVTSTDFQAEAVDRCRNRPTVLDMELLTYISSAGLRAILSLDKAVGTSKLSIINAKNSVKDVLEMSGFSDFI